MHLRTLLRQQSGLHRAFSLTQRRTFLDPRRVASASVPPPVDRLADFTRDDQISEPIVRLKDENGSIGQPQDLRRIMRNVDRKTHTLVQLSRPGNGDAPIVQIYTIMDLLKRVREKEERARQQERAARDKKPKQLELNWAISQNDLELKLKQLEDFLEKGKKVEILLAAKKRQRRATREEGDSVIKKLREKIDAVGAKEVSPMTGEILKQATLVVKKG